jgi:penicillin-binding protein
VASNPNVTFGTWIGYDTPKPIEQNYKGLSYSKRNILLWAKLMNVAHDVNPELLAPKTRFQMPDGIVSRSYCALTGELASDLCSSAGLVASDLFNVKYVPTKIDDSLTKGKYVVVKDQAYQVPSSAPAEFVQQGVMLKKDILKKHGINSVQDLKRLLPSTSRWRNLVVTEGKSIGDNGSNPSQVSGVSTGGSKLSWRANPDNDVVGYRVYAAANYSTSYKKVASIHASSTLSVTIGSSPAAYYIVAVDVAGRESSPSNIIKVGEYADKKPDPVATETDKSSKDNSQAKPPIKDKPNIPPPAANTAAEPIKSVN